MPCPRCRDSALVIRKGFFPRKNPAFDKSQRFLCKSCRTCFSQTSETLDEGQKRPDLHRAIYMLLASGVSQRRIARICGTTQVTVARKLVRMARFARIAQRQRLAAMKNSVDTAVFDEMETFEHSKFKPVAIAVAVEDGSRIMLSAVAASMPAKGLLAAVARRRYGHRIDHRKSALARTLAAVARVATTDLVAKSDACPRYPTLVRKYLPAAQHKTFKGRRGCVVGQGELKAGGWDPLFSLNHTCAMVRDNLKCLSRRTWCTTKRIDRLQCRLDLYICTHNSMIDEKNRSKTERPEKLMKAQLSPSPLLFLTSGAPGAVM